MPPHTLSNRSGFYLLVTLATQSEGRSSRASYLAKEGSLFRSLLFFSPISTKGASLNDSILLRGVSRFSPRLLHYRPIDGAVPVPRLSPPCDLHREEQNRRSNLLSCAFGHVLDGETRVVACEMWVSQEGQSDRMARHEGLYRFWELYERELRRTIIDVHREAERISEAGKINVPIKCITYMPCINTWQGDKCECLKPSEPTILF